MMDKNKKTYEEPKLMLLGDMAQMTAARSVITTGENLNASTGSEAYNRRP